MQKEKAFTLIEVLISVFILTFGLLGIAGLYINSLKRAENAYWYTLATSQLIEIIEQKKTNDKNYATWSCDCKKILPQGDCKETSKKITVCWNENLKKKCLHW